MSEIISDTDTHASTSLPDERAEMKNEDYAKLERLEFIRRTLMDIDLDLALELIEADAGDVLHILQGSKHWLARIKIARIRRRVEQLIVARNRIVEDLCRDH